MVLVILGLGLMTSASASPGYPNEVAYTGQGLHPDGTLQDNRCDDGVAPYLLFVLTATKADAADITLPWGTFDMTQSGNGAYKYMAPYQDPATLVGTVVASYTGTPRNAQLVISHGCEGGSTYPPS